MTTKRNCWEYTKCGRNLGGPNTEAFGICPAAITTRLNGIHGGKNAGRACWVVAGTFCGDVVEGTFARKHEDCADCDFYKLVKSEENASFIPASTLLRKIRCP